MYNLTKNMSIYDLGFHIYDFLSKRGFNEGNQILEEEEPVAEYLCKKLVHEIGVIENKWESIAFSTFHNPHVIYFENLETGEITDYYNMDERDKRMIEKRLDEIFSR